MPTPSPAELRAAGFPAGVLSLSDYASLNAGYWVTFSGIFDGEQQADQQREALAGAGFSGRVRWVSTRATPLEQAGRDNVDLARECLSATVRME